eukprot:5406295-Pleurochrysis_carterae.AAC.1
MLSEMMKRGVTEIETSKTTPGSTQTSGQASLQCGCRQYGVPLRQRYKSRQRSACFEAWYHIQNVSLTNRKYKQTQRAQSVLIKFKKLNRRGIRCTSINVPRYPIELGGCPKGQLCFKVLNSSGPQNDELQPVQYKTGLE